MNKQVSNKKLYTDTTSLLSSLPYSTVKEKKKNSALFTVNSKTKNTKSFTLAPKLMGGCDTIVLKSGAKILANISEINPTQIKFKNCGSVNEPDISINKDDITYVILSNGTREVFETKKQYIPPPTNFQPNNNANQNYQSQNNYNYKKEKYKKKKPQNGFSTAGFILAFSSHLVAALLGLIQAWVTNNGFFHSAGFFSLDWYFIPFGIALIAFVFCIIALYKVNKNKENQKGLTIAIIGAFLSLLLMIGVFLALVGIIH